MNEITLLGTISKPPTYHCTDRGQDLVRLSIRTRLTPAPASDRPGKTDQAEHFCHAWGPAALDLHTHLRPGDRLLVRGELSYRTHRSRTGGVQRIPEIRITAYTYLGGASPLPAPRPRARGKWIAKPAAPAN